MFLSYLDWGIIITFLLSSLGISIYYYKKSLQGDSSFFVGGRNLTWGVLGLSMVATTFAADTPLAVTEIVGKDGVSGNWLWWNGMIGGMLTAVFFSHLWRRSNVVTENEFLEMRYFGKPAKYLRVFKSVYLGLFMNVIIMGWVNLAMITVFEKFFLMPQETAFFITLGLMIIVAIYSSISGFLGVVYTDVLQFIIAMAASFALAYFVLQNPQINGLDGLKSQLKPSTLNFFPSFGDNQDGLSLSIQKFVAFFGIIWWASWYPGQEPGGGGYIAQRIAAAKDEKNATISTIFFQIAHICIRPWPWIIVALSCVVLYPELTGNNLKFGYVNAMRDNLPNGFNGLMLTGFIGAYMSTISTHLNWGSSYLINDFLKPLFYNKNKPMSNKNEINYGRIATIALMIIASIISLYIKSIESAWVFIMECGAGLGLVLILRWYWWRINAWSEIAATATPFIVFSFLKLSSYIEHNMDDKGKFVDANYASFPNSVFLIVTITTIVWITVTYLTSGKESEEKRTHLFNFYKQIKPQGIWNTIAHQIGEKVQNKGLLSRFILWITLIVFTYGCLFLIGNILFFSKDTLKLFYNIAIILGALGTILYLIKKEKILG